MKLKPKRKHTLHLMKFWAAALCGATLLTGSAVAAQTAFTYQGWLHQADQLATGTYDFQFTLTDAETNGVLLASNPVYFVPVSNGVFRVELDFGDGYFNGDERWLEIAVRPTGRATTNWTTLSPRERAPRTPYAIYAANAGLAQSAQSAHSASNVAWTGVTGLPATFADGVDNDTIYSAGSGLSLSPQNNFSVNFAGNGAADTSARSDHHHFGQSWAGSGNVGLQVNNSGNGAGIIGRQGAGSGWNWPVYAGLFGDAQYGDGVFGVSPFRGIFGMASSSNSENYGVYGTSPSPLGRGVLGFATAKTGSAIGVAGISDGPSGIGVQGTVTGTNGLNHGVVGRTPSKSGNGVFGEATALTGTPSGVHGKTASSNGRGVYGEATSKTGLNYGVYGRTESTAGRAVIGYAAATNGLTAGVMGQVASTSGRAVHGHATATAGNTVGVYGNAESPAGVGVLGQSPGVAIKAGGSGVIQSTAESIVYMAATAAHISNLDHNGMVDYGPSSVGMWISLSNNAPVGFYFPITFPTSLYGQPTTLVSAEIFYRTDGKGIRIYSTSLRGMGPNGIGDDFVHDNTTRAETDFTSYVLPLNLKLGEAVRFPTLALGVQANKQASTISIQGVRLKFRHD